MRRLPRLRQATRQGVCHGLPQGIEGCRCRPGKRPDDDAAARGEGGKKFGENGAQAARDEIASHRASYSPRNSKTGHAVRIAGQCQVDHHGVVAGPSTAAHHRGEVCGPSQSRFGGEHLRRELLAALAAASGQDRTSCTGAHTKAEAMRLGTLAVVRLESPLAHGGTPRHSGGWSNQRTYGTWLTGPGQIPNVPLAHCAKRYRLPHQRINRPHRHAESTLRIGDVISTACAESCGQPIEGANTGGSGGRDAKH
jgi:hypothetical protein